MKRIALLSFLVILLSIFAVSCKMEVTEPSTSVSDTTNTSSNTGNASSQTGDDAIIQIKDGAVTNLKDMKEDEERLFQLAEGEDESSVFYLEGATLGSLYVLERVSDSDARAVSRDINSELVSIENSDGLFVILPQGDGKVSFSAKDIGLLKEGLFKLKRVILGSDPKTSANGDLYFEYRIYNTLYNHELAGEAQWLWPTYLRHYFIDFDDPIWSRYKDQKIVLMPQKVYYDSDGGSITTGCYGLFDSKSFTYDTDPTIQGLYDTTGKEYMNIFSFLRTADSNSDDHRNQIYLVLPKELTVDSGPVEIKSLPFAALFKVEEKKPYVISFTDLVESDMNTILVSGFLSAASMPILAGEHNGDLFRESGYVIRKVEHDGKYDADVYLSDIGEDFIVKLSSMYNDSKTSFGKISFRAATQSEIDYINGITIDPSEEAGKGIQEVALAADECWNINWRVPANDSNLYLLSVSSEKDAMTMGQWSEVSHGRAVSAGNPVFVNAYLSGQEDGRKGVLANGNLSVFHFSEASTLKWRVEIVDEVKEHRNLTYISVKGTPVTQRANYAVDTTGLKVYAHYMYGPDEDVTNKATVVNSQNGTDTWGDAISVDKEGNDYNYDNKEYIQFSYTEGLETKTAKTAAIKLRGGLAPNTANNPYPIETVSGNYLLFDISGYEKLVDAMDPESKSGYLLSGASAGDEAWAIFTADDYADDDPVDWNRMIGGDYMGSECIEIEGDGTVPWTGWYGDNEDNAVVFCWSLSKNKTNEELKTALDDRGFVLIVGELANDIEPAVGIKKSDFREGAKTFFFNCVAP